MSTAPLILDVRDDWMGGGMYGVVYACRRCAAWFRGAELSAPDCMLCVKCGGDVRVVARDRAAVAKEMQQLMKRESRLKAMAAELRGLSYGDLAETTEYVARVERARWWDRAAELGVGIGSTAAEIRALAVRVMAEARASESA